MIDLNLPGWGRELVEESAVARLALLDGEGRPRVLPVTFVAHAGAIWSAVDDKPKRVPGRELARVRWLRQRPEAALCVDRYSDDWSQLAWVQLLGRVAVVEASEEPAAIQALAEKYAPYAERTPGGPLLRLDVQRALHWNAAAS